MSIKIKAYNGQEHLMSDDVYVQLVDHHYPKGTLLRLIYTRNLGGSNVRDICRVIDQMDALVPNYDWCLKFGLKDIKDSVGYTAPEAIVMRWEQLQEHLMYSIGMNPTQEYQFEVLSVFSGMTVDQIKDEIKKEKDKIKS